MPGIPAWTLLVPAVLLAPGCATSPSPGEDGPAAEDAAPMVQPGAPGEPSRIVDPDDLGDVAGEAYTAADVRFMQGMIPHHAQALEMVALIRGRTDSDELRRLALRIRISQRDEIGLISRWLRERGEDVPEYAPMVLEPSGEGGAGGEGEAGQEGGRQEMSAHRDLMPGMLTPADMRRLAAARGDDFVRLWLELMIAHHQGAIAMVHDLFSSPGGGQESEVFRFASDVDADQQAEIRRMRLMLRELGAPDPDP